MTTPLVFRAFSGLAPRVTPRLLPDNGAQVAANAVLTSGDLKPVRGLKLTHSPAIAGPWLAVHRAEYDGVEHWLSWTKDVDVALSPFPADTEPRYYITGDNEPRYANFSDLPSTWYALGVPAPQTTPGVSASGGTGATVSRLYCYTYFSALGEESAPSPASAVVTGKVDDTWVIVGMDEIPTSGTDCTTGFAAGVTTVTCGTNKHWLRVGDEVTLSGATGVVSEVTSPTVYKLVGNYTGATWARVRAWNMVGAKRRLYRSAGTVASFQLVHDDVSTTYNDTLTDALILGDELISDGWLTPPTGLRGIITLPNGASCGFVGKQLCLSEPYQPHAWPDANKYGTDYDIVGIAAYGSTIVAATAAMPYVADGNEPSQMALQRIDQKWPCRSKQSVKSVGDGVLYASSYGLAYVGMGGARIWTADTFTKVEWVPLNPETMHLAVAEDRVFVAYTTTSGVRTMLVFHPGEQAALTELALESSALYADPKTGNLYVVDGTGVQQWDAQEGVFLFYTWQSKEVELPFPQNYGACKIEWVGTATSTDQQAAQAAYLATLVANAAIISGGDLIGDYSEDDFCDLAICEDNLTEAIAGASIDKLTFKLFAGGKERMVKTIFSAEPFRLPAGYKADSISVLVSGTVRVLNIKLAETIVGLRAV